MKRYLATIALVAALALPACGSSPTPPPAADATATVAALKASGLPIGDVVTVTAATDGNNLLGRPNGYTSKADFRDTRLKSSGKTEIDTSEGGAVEVWPTADGATARMDYIQKIGKSSPLFAEYDYVKGGTLLRLSRLLTPDQAKAYNDAFQK